MENVKKDMEKMKMEEKAEGESDKDIEDWAKKVEGLIKRDLEYVKRSKEERRKGKIETNIKMIEDESKNIKEEKKVNIYELNRALKNHAKSFEVEVVSDISPIKQAVMTRNNKKRSHTQLDSREQVIAFQDRVMTINIKEAQHPLK